MDTIFEEFGQADASTTRTHGGTGLGLTISSRLVKLMGGRIWVTSELDQGSKFHFTVDFGLRSVPSLESPVPAKLHDLPVLVVADHDINRRIFADMLTGWHLRPKLVNGPGPALDALTSAVQTKEPFRVILLDATMPEMSGFELAGSIRQMPGYRETPMLISSSASLPDQFSQAEQLGIDRCLSKPVKQADLFEAITQALGVMDLEDTDAAVEESTAPLRILLAEDGLVNQRVAIDLIEQDGHEVVLAEDGEKAVDRCQGSTFDLILMDIHMPEMDGYEAAFRIREWEQEHDLGSTPIVALTANAMKGDREKCLAAGMNDYLAKPIRAEELFAVVRRNAPPTPVGPGKVFPTAAATETATAAAVFDSTERTFDLATALTNVGGSEDILLSMIDCYFEERDGLVPDIEKAIPDGD
ncbi:MAG: response regulator, partial [Limisphaerales bacterium]